ncbi:MAG: demethoxyubiquinone hydroxylase family protein [Rickettsiaceae bacterium]|nr:demethoxyubiquinone hydroxylase family protein [Rickettsiaceae bacterium]
MKKPLFNPEKIIHEIIRVDYAGEFGAVRIYQGQLDAVKDPKTSAEIIHMKKQEDIHLEFFTKKMHQESVRPSVLMNLWSFMGYSLGRITAQAGAKYAMICTESVELVIEKHYQNQINFLKSAKIEKELLKNIQKFREQEIEHKIHAEEYTKSFLAIDYFIKNTIKTICSIAIFLSRKI